RIVERLLGDQLAEGVGALVAEQQHGTVGGPFGNACSASRSARAADILDDELLAKPLGQMLRKDARRNVDWTAGRERHHQGDGACRPILWRSLCLRRDSNDCKNGSQYCSHHVVLPGQTVALFVSLARAMAASIGDDAGGLDYLAPALDVLRQILREILRR